MQVVTFLICATEFYLCAFQTLRLGQGVTTGHVVNLVSTDTQSFDRVRCNLVKVNFCRTVIFLIILFIYNIDNENFFKVVIYSLVHRLLISVFLCFDSVCYLFALYLDYSCSNGCHDLLAVDSVRSFLLCTSGTYAPLNNLSVTSWQSVCYVEVRLNHLES